MRPAFVLSVCALALGCVTAHTQRLDPQTRPARAPESVAVLDEAPARPFTVIGRVEARADTVFKGFDDLRARIVEQAALLGGDAVILGPEAKDTDFLILTTGMIASERKKLAGEVIVFR